MQHLAVVCCSPSMAISTGNRKGYPTDILRDIQVPIGKYLCVLCNLILKNPVQRFCGHRYCKNCIDEANEASAGSDTVCPACVEDDNQDEVPDNTVRQASLVLQLLTVSCGIDLCLSVCLLAINSMMLELGETAACLTYN